MPLYYNPAPPSDNDKNSITRTATDYGLRDFLLSKNIQNPIRYPQLTTSINGSPRGGEPVLDTMVGIGSVLQQNTLTELGIHRYENAIIMNQYKNTDSTAPDFISIENIIKVPIFETTTSPNGTGDYTDIDNNRYGLLAKSNEKKYRELSTLKSLYVDNSKQIDISDLISLQPIQYQQQLTNYIDEYGYLANNDTFTDISNILGSVINGQGLGLAKGGIVDNFDIRSSLAGRVLTSTGIMNDTKLGIIGAQQLALSLANNFAFNTQQELFGKLNVSDNILSLVRNGTLQGFRPDYKITIASDNIVLDYSQRVLGFTVPRSYLPNEASIFQNENGNVSSIIRSNTMLEYTSRGQIQSLSNQFYANLNGLSDVDNPMLTPFRNGYSPSYQKGSNGDFIVSGKIPLIYAFNNSPNSGIPYPFTKQLTEDNTIPEISYNRDKMVENSGFVGLDGKTYTVNDGRAFATTFSWNSNNDSATNAITESDEYNGGVTEVTKKSLLVKTQKLFNSVGMKTLVSVKGDKQVTNKTQLQTSVSPNGFISKGSGVLSGDKFTPDGLFDINSSDTPDNTFCRSWTPYDRYDTVSKLIRNKGLNQNSNGSPIFGGANQWRVSTDGSVLDDNGFVKIAPYKTDNLTRNLNGDSPKKYMFSIENLAWVGSPSLNLLPCEQGPGDLLTGKFGRIMWFPPYDLKFSESSSVNFESNTFIGRGEPIYTYNNTERSGTLSFKIIVDHPSIINSFAGDNGPSDEFIRSWFAGCLDLDERWADKLTQDELIQKEANNIKDVPKVELTPIQLPDNFAIYFKNDRIDVDPLYESKPIGEPGIAPYESIELEYRRQPDGTCKKQRYKRIWDDVRSYGLNLKTINIGTTTFTNGWIDNNFGNTLKEYLNGEQFRNRKITITVVGFASTQGCVDQNLILAKGRADNTKAWLESILLPLDNNITIIATTGGETGPEFTDGVNEWEKTPKQARRADIIFSIDNTKTDAVVDAVISNNQNNVTINENIRRRFYTECDFFEKIKETDQFIYDKIRQKIKYFHPSFHSMTPEGFNSRLTFLLQCTRQGPTIKDVEAKNLAFGPPPVCILRIGDFYNTKIVIDNISFDFEEQLWDLNPEGVGVQPMIANVSMSFKYIGGSSLYGPINKLQNALSFNYFANTHVYDVRADYIAKSSDANVNNENGNNRSENNINKIIQNEGSFGLVRGLDLTSNSMNGIDENEVTNKQLTSVKDVLQTEVANSVNSTSIVNTLNVKDFQKFKLVNINYNFTDNLSFSLVRIKPDDKSNLNNNYSLRLVITNTLNSNESYQMLLSNALSKTDINYSVMIPLSSLTPICKILNTKTGLYNIRIDFILNNKNTGSVFGTINNKLS